MTKTIRNLVVCLSVSLAARALSAVRASSNVQVQAVEQDTATDSVQCMSTMTNDGLGEQAMCGKCGDGFCNPHCGETATSCPADCGGTTI